MSLYVTYRPHRFADVIGQDHIVTTLEQAAEQDKLAHAYLFAGPRGTGKTSIARILARLLLTKDIEDETLKEQIVRDIDEGHIVDMVEIDAASNRRIEDIRSLLESIQFAPAVAKRKVYIIDEAHMLTKESFNALLKTLEEPPSYAYFILATTELHKIPSTIQSRCQRFLFRHIREEDIIRTLQLIADQEHIAADRTALRSIAASALGGLRDAISILDQLHSLPRITADEVKQRIGETGQDYVTEAFDAVRSQDHARTLAIIERMEEMAVPPENFLRLLLATVRTSLHEAVAANDPTVPTYLSMLTLLLNALKDLRTAPSPNLVLETALLSLCNPPSQHAPHPAIVPPLPPLPVQPQKTTATPKTVAKKEEGKPEQTEPSLREENPAATSIEAPEFTLESIASAWPSILASTEPASVKMSLKNGRVTNVQGSTITLSFTSSFHREKVMQTDACRSIEETISAIFKRPVKLHCILDEEEHSTPKTDKDIVDLAEIASEIF